MAHGVDDEACLHAVGGEEDCVAVQEALSYSGLCHVSGYRLVANGPAGLPRDPLAPAIWECMTDEELERVQALFMRALRR